MTITCPSCQAEIACELEAVLPEETSLTFVFQIEPGQMIQAKTLSGVVGAFDDMQRAIGEEVGVTTTTLIEKLETADNEIRITFRIANQPASGIEAAPADETTQIGSAEGESPAPQGDAQPIDSAANKAAAEGGGE